jgi:hypothetical protein
MNKSKNGRPFRVAKEIHLVTLQTLIKVCFQLRSLVVDLSTSIGLFIFLSFGSCHGLGYFGILLTISWPRIFWDTFDNIMA